MKLIVGLGNPGEKYQNVRHNLGFEVVKNYIKHTFPNSSWDLDKKLKSEVFKYGDLIFAKPQTFMNNSGMAVRLLADFYKIAAPNITIVHDELDLPLGKIKVRIGGAAAGHHGVESIIKDLETDKFVRIRLGIGNTKTQAAERKKVHVSAEKFVLEPFIRSEKSQVKHMIKQSLKAIKTLLEDGIEKAQNQFN
jgi:peptidyl-tRNA hydrolase, PTH1 family